MFDLISIGDVVIDTIVPFPEATILEKDSVKYFGLPYGHKVPVDSSISVVGGNAANNAVGSARLGLKTAIYTNVGNKDDDFADDRIKAKLQKEKVDLRYVIETDDLPSNHNIVLDFGGERTILIHHQPWKFKLPDLDKSKWVYLTSLSPSYTDSNLIDQLINYLERTNCKLAFQPGTFQIKQGAKKQARLFSLSEILILNKEEAKILLSLRVDENIPIKKMLKKLADLGPKRVVITDGKDGSFSFDGENYYKMGIFPSETVEMTGAGDAYACALVAALFYGNSLEQSMCWGAANSAAVVEKIGPQAGLLTYEKLQSVLSANKDLTAKLF